MLRARKPDSLSAKLYRDTRVLRRVGVGADPKAAHTVGPSHEQGEVSGDLRFYRLDVHVINIAGGAVKRYIIAFLDQLTTKCKLFRGHVKLDVLASGYAAASHPARYYRRVAGHAAPYRKYAL